MERWRLGLAISAVVAMAAVAAAAVVVAIDNAPQVAAATDEGTLDDRLSRLEEDVRRAEKELAEAKAQQKELRQRLHEAERRAEFLRLLGKELTLVGGGGSCAQAGLMSVEFLDPVPGTSTSSPVVVHLLTAEPLGCQADYYLTVDGIPFRPRGSEGGPGKPDSPVPFRPMRKGDPTDACVSGVFGYVELDLSPGLHTVQVNGGCPQGTPTSTTSVSFVVT